MSLRIRTLAIVGVAGLALSGVTATAAASTGSSGWAATATQSLSKLLVHATNLGALRPSSVIRIDVGLAVRRTGELVTLAETESTRGSAAFGSSLTSKQFVSEFGPSTSTVDAVVHYLGNEGFTHVSVDTNRLMITAVGTAADVESAFNTQLDTFGLGGRTIYANVSGAFVPASLAGDVSAVLGLNDIAMNAISPSVATPKAPLSGYYPKEFQTVYGAAGTPTGSKTNIAVFAEGDVTQVITDLRTAEKAQGLPLVPVTVVPTGPSMPDTSGVDEWDLDTQVSTGMAQTVNRLYIYDEATMTDTDLAHSINVWASQDSAQLGSASIGEPDVLAWLDGAMFSIDTAVEEAAVQGQSFFASTGDTGASCAIESTNGVPDSGLTAALCYPADGTWSTAVGGTTLITDASDNYTDELAWNAGGGGVSYFEYPGPWTDTANAASAGGFRGSPDIAMDADLTTGANIYVDGTAETIGGTSVSSPLAMGAIARVSSALNNKLGTAVLRFYSLYNAANPAAGGLNATPGFHDVLAGSNGLYSAAPGWDYTTGIGSIDVAPLIAALGGSSETAPAATVPGTPTIGSATARNAGASVAFTAPSSSGGQSISSYQVLESTGGSYTSATTSPATCTASPCKVSELANGTAYTFEVEATNGVGTGSASSASASVIPVTVPAAPSIYKVTVGNKTIKVVWTAPPSDGGTVITGYTASAKSGPHTFTCQSAAKSCVIHGLTNGRTYKISVLAKNAVGSSLSTATKNAKPRK